MQIVIETRDLTKKIGDITAVSNLNIDVRKGEVFGFLGPNGDGNSISPLRILIGPEHQFHEWICRWIEVVT